MELDLLINIDKNIYIISVVLQLFLIWEIIKILFTLFNNWFFGGV